MKVVLDTDVVVSGTFYGGVPFEIVQAAAAPMAGLTALQALRDAGRMRPGQKVPIVGAGGGVGAFAVQIARSCGAQVTGVCGASNEERYDLILGQRAAALVVAPPARAEPRRHAGAGVLLIKAPLLALFAPQRIRVCTERPRRKDLRVLKELMESGKLTPVVGRTYPLSRTHEAISYFGEGHAQGKVVITV